MSVKLKNNIRGDLFFKLKFELMKMIVENDKQKTLPQNIEYKKDEDGNIVDADIHRDNLSWIDCVFKFLYTFYSDSISYGYLSELILVIIDFLNQVSMLKDLYIQYLLKKFNRKLDFNFIFTIIDKSFDNQRKKIEMKKSTRKISTVETTKLNWILNAHDILINKLHRNLNKLDLLLFLIIIIIINDNINYLEKENS